MHQSQKKSRRQEKIQWILEEFKGIKNTSCIKSAKKRTLIPKIKNEKTKQSHQEKEFGNVFGEFNSKLYAEEQCEEVEHDLRKSDTRTKKEGKSSEGEEMYQIPEFTKNEVQAAIDSLERRQRK